MEGEAAGAKREHGTMEWDVRTSVLQTQPTDLLGSITGFGVLFQAEDGIRDVAVTGVQTCALPIWPSISKLLVLIMLKLLTGLK